jgi:hypothetical protein
MRPSVTSARVLGLAGLLLVAACGSGGGSTGPGQPLPECTGDVSIQVSTGTQPTFSWTPACRLFFLNVEPATSGGDLWPVISRGANRIAPGVKYGVVPAGAEQLQAPVPLVAGQSYKVALARYTGPGADDGVLVGVETFTP